MERLATSHYGYWDIGEACHVTLQVDSHRNAPCRTPITQSTVPAVTLPGFQLARFEKAMSAELAQLCKAPHLKF